MIKLLTAVLGNVFIALFAIGSLFHAQVQNKKLITTVPSVDLERYKGLWYEIAKIPNRFQKKNVSGEQRRNMS